MVDFLFFEGSGSEVENFPLPPDCLMIDAGQLQISVRTSIVTIDYWMVNRVICRHATKWPYGVWPPSLRYKDPLPQNMRPSHLPHRFLSSRVAHPL
jgi:hypothetical protein